MRNGNPVLEDAFCAYHLVSGETRDHCRRAVSPRRDRANVAMTFIASPLQYNYIMTFFAFYCTFFAINC